MIKMIQRLSRPLFKPEVDDCSFFPDRLLTEPKGKGYGPTLLVQHLLMSILLGLIPWGLLGFESKVTVAAPWENAGTTSIQRIGEPSVPKSENASNSPVPLVTLDGRPQHQLELPSIPITSLEKRGEASEVRKALDEAEQSLTQRHWHEARLVLEKTLRRFPQNEEAQILFRKTRCSCDVVGRYGDESYCNMLRSLDRGAGLLLFDEVFTNILKYHVDTPHYNELFQFGLDAVSLSFSEPIFLKYHAVSENNVENLSKYCLILKEESAKWNINSATILKDCIAGIADLVEKGTGIPASAVVMEFLCGITTSLDAYSTFLTENQIEDIYSMIDGHFVGLGVELKTEKNGLLVTRVIPGSPAFRAGLKKGEQITLIDGRPAISLDHPEQAGALLQGAEGSSVVLRMQAVDQKTLRDVRVIRQRVDVPSVENVHIMNENDLGDRVGYVRVTCFQKTTVTEMVQAVEYLITQKMACLIIDLRQNPGGLLQEAIEATNLFLDRGTIVKTRGRMTERPYFARELGTCPIPLVVLIDGSSASASEIFAGAIRDNHRGTIVGHQSYGKGTVQAIIQLTGSPRSYRPIAGLRLTTEKFYSPSGAPYSGIGVVPDIPITEEGEELSEWTRHIVARPETGASSKKQDNYVTPETQEDQCLARAFLEAQRMLVK